MKETGIVGPAGTTFLGRRLLFGGIKKIGNRAIIEGLYLILSKENGEIYGTHYGPSRSSSSHWMAYFLAARKEVWEASGSRRNHNTFKGEWDFYDIHYTTKSHSLGYKNYTVPIDLIHHSRR